MSIEPRTTRHVTRQDAIEEGIVVALDGRDGEFDLEGISYEAYEWRIDTNEQGQELLNTGGFELVVDDQQFWEIVARHDISAMLAELEGIAAERARTVAELDERRDQLVRSLMGTSVARKRIAAAAELSEPRLYQIRDGRR